MPTRVQWLGKGFRLAQSWPPLVRYVLHRAAIC
jgi:hypothetical protein